MWKYLLESFRNKKNRPMSFLVNWLGLTLGMVAVVVIYLYVSQELRHDKGVYESSMESVYRCHTESLGAIVPSGARRMLADMPEVKSAVRVCMGSFVVATEGLAVNKKMRMSYLAADTTLFDVLTFKFISGSVKNAMVNPNSVIVSRAVAIKLFATEDVIGRSVKINDQVSGQISAVMEDIPSNSTLSPEIIFTMQILMQLWNNDIGWMENNWGHWNFETYLTIKEGVDPTAFEVKYEKELKDKISKAWGSEYKEKCSIVNFNDIYFSQNDDTGYAKTIDRDGIMVMVFVALLVLAIAIINYVNIYTARATEVVRAMGIKTIMGANRGQLIGFVIFDSIVIAFLSALSAFVIAWGLEPFYIDVIGAKVSFNLNWDLVLGLFVGIPILCGIIAGIFPAIALTRMKALDALANRSSGNRAMGYVRNILIVLQFTISIALIGTTLFINKQMHYISDMDLGYNKENIVFVDGSNFIGTKFDIFRNKLLDNSSIVNVSLIKNSPVSVNEFQTLSWGKTKEEQYTSKLQWADQYCLSLLGLHMIEGDSIVDVQAKVAGERKYIINESFAKIIRAQNPEVTFPFKQFVGVFSDYHSGSVKEAVKPMCLTSVWHSLKFDVYGDAYIKINGSELDKTLDYIEKTFNELYPDQLYEFDFLDEQFAQMYRDEQLFRSRLLTFSILAIFISCLGLFALVGYSVERRRKEIAIRKVYGSTISGILSLLMVSFLKWLVVSFVIAAPIIYYISYSWVQQFQYKSELSWWIFVVAFGVCFFVAIVTVLGQAYIAATENPAKSVKAN